MKPTIFPSIMAKNQKEMNKLFSKLEDVAKELHLDIADGKFVPNTSLNFNFKLSKKFKYNAHLMIRNPEKWIEENGKKVDMIIFHVESIKGNKIKKINDLIKKIRKIKKKVGLALKPETKVKEIKLYLNKIDYILILTVHPGFYGARYLKSPLRKIKQIRKINPKIKVIDDGGMNPKTIKEAYKAGTDYIVSGSYITRSENPRKAMQELRKAAASYVPGHKNFKL